MQLSGEENRGFFENPKVVFGFILVLVVAAVGLSAYRVADGIRGGFVPPASNGNSEGALLSSAEDVNTEALKGKDTDGDSISDYDELYQYKSSPYLKDTDSDGVDDKAEIGAGKDPNCPEGKSCKQVVPEVPDSTVLDNAFLGGVAEDLANQPASSLDVEAGSEIGDSLQADADANEAVQQLQNLTPQQIRELLLDSGKMTKEQLDQISDETLLTTFQEVVQTSNQ